MTTHILVQEYNGKVLELTYTINQQISGSNEIIVKEVHAGGFELQMEEETLYEKYTEKEYMDRLTLKGMVIGLTNKIHIISLAPADNELFENLEELPYCIEFKVDSGLNLSKIPKINNQEYKTDVCPICLSLLFTYDNGGPVVALGPKGCGHKFHDNCLYKALKTTKQHCPLCRKLILGTLPIAIERAERAEQVGGRRIKSKKGKKSRKRNKTRKSKKGKKSRK